MLELDHPQTDPRYPSFHHPVLADIVEELNLTGDCWDRLRHVKANYVRQEAKEPDGAYRARLDRAVYMGFFRDALQAFAGVLSRYQLRNPPPSFELFRDNIDMEGNSDKAFFLHADGMTLRDGGILLVVDMPADPPKDRATEQRAERRPYITSHVRPLLLNWWVQNKNGVETVQQCTLLEVEQVPDGDFGMKMQVRYRVIGAGWWKLLELRRGTAGDYVIEEVEAGRVVEQGRHAELLARRGSYHALWSSQQRGAEHGEPAVGDRPPPAVTP